MNAIELIPHGRFLFEVEHAKFPPSPVTLGSLYFCEKSFPVIYSAFLRETFRLLRKKRIGMSRKRIGMSRKRDWNEKEMDWNEQDFLKFESCIGTNLEK